MTQQKPFVVTFEDVIRSLLTHIGDDPNREGLRETPDRVRRSYQELFGGYKQDPHAIMKTFEDGACDEIVICKGISFTSFCEHHLLPFTGTVDIGYLPDKRILGLSKLARLVEVFSKRLQVQERLTTQIAEALMTGLLPRGCGCIVRAQHFCMVCRGVRQQNAVMVTSSLKGEFLQPEVRGEFLYLLKD